MQQIRITEAMIVSFGQYLKDEEKSMATIRKYLHDLKQFSRFAGQRTADRSLVVEYKETIKKKYSIIGANSMLAALNSFFKFAGVESLCVKQFKIQRKVYCPEERELRKDEYLRLIEASENAKNMRLSMVIQTICGTGIRVSELEYITVEAVKKGEATVACKGKVRTVFIVSKLRKKLLKYISSCGIKSGKVFITKNGKSLDRSNIWKEMKSICQTAGVSPKKVFPHNLRHLFARAFYEVKKDIAKLADVLGHSSINTTRIYIMSTGEEHRRQVEKMRLIM